MSDESERRAATIRRWADAFNCLDVYALIDELDPEIELSEWPTAPGARTYHGYDGVRMALDTWFEAWEWMHVDVEDIREAGDNALVMLHQRAKGKGSEVEVEIMAFGVYTFDKSKVVRIQLFTEREPALAAAGLTPHYEEETR